MQDSPTISYSHVALHCFDLKKMVDFYTRVMKLRVTDRGDLFVPDKTRIVFLSSDPGNHHQLALVEGRTADEKLLFLNHMAFRLASLARLRAFHETLKKEEITHIRPINHGNAWSIYFRDPERNRIETFVDTPWHVQQPVVEPLDLSLSDAEILRVTEERFKGDPSFRPISQWRAEFPSEPDPGS